MDLLIIGTIAVASIIFIALLGFALARLYKRASEETAFVRTGLGGRKVIMSGGTLVLPVFHQTIEINRNTLRLEVSRNEERSLITKDRLRVDATAEFYVRVAPSEDAIATAAQTLGAKTNEPEQLKNLIEGKFVDALRSAAASMTMNELHEQRSSFVNKVKEAVQEDLKKNGLELEAVSLTSLNQTKKQFFVKDNAFDAEGLLKLTQEIESRNKAINDITQETAIRIAEKNLQATQQQLELDRKQKEATLNQELEIARMSAEQQATISATQAEGLRKSQEAELAARQEVEQRRISVERSIAEAEAARKMAVETAELNSRTAVKLREQEQNITVAERSQAEASANAEAALAQAKAVAAEQQIITARELEIAQREKSVALVKAEETARKDSIKIEVQAEAEARAALNRAQAITTAAKAEADAAVLKATAIKEEGNALAETIAAQNNAKNLLSVELIAQQIKLALIEQLPAIIEKQVEPLKHIDSIRIAEVSGLNGVAGGASSTGAGAENNQNLGSQMVNAALRYRANQPLVDSLLSEVGLKSGSNLDTMVSSAVESLAVTTPVSTDNPSQE